ncbi:MAG: methionyl-tRNA formyltransferase [Gemmataceae bacterium]|nr:methionyl-tRNA formyltransferase [Gemmataceae bacterium]
MMGTGGFAEPTLEALLASKHAVVGLVTQPDRVVGEKRGTTRQVGKGMKEIALERTIPVYQPESINTPEGVAKLMEWKPDLLVVAAYGQILNRDVLSAAPRGGINVHASLLPKYRGAAPIAWAIHHGEKESGVTIIRMSTALDAGDMLMQEAVPIGPDETAGELESRLGPLGSRMALQTIEQLETGTTKGIQQDKSLVTKAPKLTKEMGLIDWSRPAPAVWNQIRSMHPWPSAYCYLHRPSAEPMRLIVFKAHPVVETSLLTCSNSSSESKQDRQDNNLVATKAEAGAVHVEGNALLVRCGEGCLALDEVQPAGKRRMNIIDFLRGNAIPAGSRMGAA